ncbi:prefoldin subunit 5 [Penaeus vannamei]|uniref:Prefoldin subunit n=1 Tax=Penaeus vannamei TaxID=6689 RepID=A0A423THR5_PENVA|nr:prefoldin subunit 5-like [Penaeus vannamei]XP_047490418.1 prefoldin subunit 5-like [Penaeus chinensis]ROT75999.1 prefoldin subunit [Penaeus vannamei]
MASSKGSGPQVIDISKLNLEQLTNLKNQLDQELQFFNESLQQLKIAQLKFNESGECVDKVTPEVKGKEVLVPLTSCMYVPGTIADAEKLLIDIGTGYYVERDVPGAKDYFTRKVKFVTEQMEKIQKIAAEKSKLREVVMDIMEVKVDQQLAAIQQQQAATGAAKA